MVQIGKYRVTFQAIGIILLFIFGVAPIVLAALPNVKYNETFSIYNTGYDGLSIVRSELEAVTTADGSPRYNITTSVSNLNALNRFNGSGVLVSVGPTAKYDQAEFISLLLFLLKGGSLIIADDFGTGNEILKPLFDAFSGYDKFVENAKDLGMDLPNLGQIIDQAVGNSTTPTQDQTGGSIGSIPGGSINQGDFATSILNMTGKIIRSFGFNGSVLMDLGSNDGNPNRPLITDVDQSSGPYSFTQGVSKVQTEMATIISLKINTTIDVPDGNGGVKTIVKEVWQPLTKLTFSELVGSDTDLGGADILRYLDFLFPLYSSKFSWIETDRKAAADNTAVPDPGKEWGDAAFALALNLPIIPGGGKIVFIADPSIFINRWTSKTAENDNLLLIKNLMEMVSSNQEGAGVPIIFDFGHTYQSLLSPSLYSTALLKLIANMSMFPLVAPFVPLTFYAFGKKLVPKTRRLRPMLLTKRRGVKGFSNFEQELEKIKENSLYGEPIHALTNRLKRELRRDVRYEGSQLVTPDDVANFFSTNFPERFNKRELRNNIRRIYKVANQPTRPVTIIIAKPALILLKDLISLLD